VTALLDTSVLVRYFTFDPPDQGAHAQALVESGEPFYIPAVALAETGFTLNKRYGLPREDVVNLLVGLLGLGNVAVLEFSNAIALQALEFCRPSGRVSFADSLLWATALSSGNTTVYAFDRRFPSSGIDLRLLDGDSAPSGASSA
jgi:predicted nucleic-acid-binding protein